MNSITNPRSKRNLILKIGIPVLILAVIVGIWAIKNSQNNEKPVVDSNADLTLNVTEKLDLQKLKSYNVPIIIEFGSDSCIPCKQMAPIIEALNEELQGKAIIKFVDVWENQSFADGYPISVIPTQIFIDANGKPYNPKDPDALQMKLYSDQNTNQHTFTAHEGTITKEQLLTILKEMGMK
jgi:thioredoxin 1